MHFVGQTIAFCGLSSWAFGPRNFMKKWGGRFFDPAALGAGQTTQTDRLPHGGNSQVNSIGLNPTYRSWQPLP